MERGRRRREGRRRRDEAELRGGGSEIALIPALCCAVCAFFCFLFFVFCFCFGLELAFISDKHTDTQKKGAENNTSECTRV